MKTAIVILNYNGEKLLEQFLPTIISFSTLAETEIIVADNHSSDNSLQLLKEKFPSIKTICLDKNYGFAGGYNKALKQVEAEYYILLNSDVEVTENWLTAIDFMDKNRDIAACQPKIKSWENRNSFEYAGASGGFMDKYGYPFCRGRIFDSIEQDDSQYDSVCDLFWASGACLIIRSNDFWDCNGFDDSFFAHMEEIDLCWRLHQKGRRIVCFPQSTIYHVGAKTLEKEHPYKTYLNFRNNLLMLYKNLPEKNLKKVLFIRFLLDHVAMLQNLFTGKKKNAKSIILAWKEFYRIKKEFLPKRENIQASGKGLLPQETLQTSILWLFYVKRKRKFSELK